MKKRQLEYLSDSSPNYAYGRYEVYEAVLSSGDTYVVSLSREEYEKQRTKATSAQTEQHKNYYANHFSYFERFSETTKELRDIREFCSILKKVCDTIK
jgi:glutamyl/glutaminyl-tRNA synthetase